MAKKQTANEKTKPEFVTDEPVGTEMEPEPEPEMEPLAEAEAEAEVEVEPAEPDPAEPLPPLGEPVDLDNEIPGSSIQIAVSCLAYVRNYYTNYPDQHIRDTAFTYLNYLESHCHGK